MGYRSKYKGYVVMARNSEKYLENNSQAMP